MFLINLIPLHVLALMVTGRFSHRIYVAYCSVSKRYFGTFFGSVFHSMWKILCIIICWLNKFSSALKGSRVHPRLYNTIETGRSMVKHCSYTKK